jgi:hypothetical protein
MWFRFVLVSLLFLSYNIVIESYISNMICDIQNNDIINYYNPNKNTDIIHYYNAKQNNESFILNGDIEEGMGESDVYDGRAQIPKISKSNYLVFELISNMSYKIMKNMKQIVSKQINYFYPSSIKNEMENYL